MRSPKPSADFSLTAFRVIQEATSEAPPTSKPEEPENGPHGVALYLTHSTFARPQVTLSKSSRKTPAMAAGLTEYVWSVSELRGFGDANCYTTPHQDRPADPSCCGPGAARRGTSAS